MVMVVNASGAVLSVYSAQPAVYRGCAKARIPAKAAGALRPGPSRAGGGHAPLRGRSPRNPRLSVFGISAVILHIRRHASLGARPQCIYPHVPCVLLLFVRPGVEPASVR